MAKIGLPSLKLNNAGQKSKSCGDFRSVAEEALKERKGHDPDIDLSKADQNIYTGYQTAAELIEYSRNHIDQLKDKTGRGIRKDAVVMCATILKPPADFMNRMSREDQIRFLADAEKAFVDIVGRDNIKSTAIHFDEQGAHEHVFWEPITADGRLCAKEVHNLQFFGRVNRELPERLREAGWEIENCEMYDAAQKEYEQEKGMAEKKSGQSSARFKAEAEKQKRALQKEIGELQVAKNDLEVIAGELTDKANEYGFEAQINQELAEKTRQELSEARQELSKVEDEINTLEAKKEAIEAHIKDLTAKDKRAREILDRSAENLKIRQGELISMQEQMIEHKQELAILKKAVKKEQDEAERTIGSGRLDFRMSEVRKDIAEEQKHKENERKANLLDQFLEFPGVRILWEQFMRWRSGRKEKEKTRFKTVWDKVDGQER